MRDPFGKWQRQSPRANEAPKPGEKLFAAAASDLQLWEDHMLEQEAGVRASMHSGVPRLPAEFKNSAFFNWHQLRQELMRSNQPGYKIQHSKFNITPEQVEIIDKSLPIRQDKTEKSMTAQIAMSLMREYLPTQLATWFSRSRKVYSLSDDDIGAFLDHDFKDLKWRDLKRPYGGFAAEFQNPLEIHDPGEVQKGKKIRGIIVTQPSLVDPEFDESQLFIRLLYENADGSTIKPTISNSDRKRLKAKAQDSKDAKTFEDFALTLRSAEKKTGDEERYREVGDTSQTIGFDASESIEASDFTELGNSLRKIIAGLSLFVTQKRGSLNYGDQSPRTPGIANMAGFVRDEAEMFDLKEILNFREHPTDYMPKPGGGTVRPHARQGHWRRDWRKPDEEIWVSDTVVRRDLLPRDTLLPGSAIKFRPEFTRRRRELE